MQKPLSFSMEHLISAVLSSYTVPTHTYAVRETDVDTCVRMFLNRDQAYRFAIHCTLCNLEMSGRPIPPRARNCTSLPTLLNTLDPKKAFIVREHDITQISAWKPLSSHVQSKLPSFFVKLD